MIDGYNFGSAIDPRIADKVGYEMHLHAEEFCA